MSSLAPALPTSPADEDIVHTIAPKHSTSSPQHRHPLLAALDALPQTEPLSSTLDPPSIAQQPLDSPYRIEPIQRIDARAVDELLRLCQQYVKDDVQQLLADQRDTARRLDALDEDLSQLPLALRSMNDEVRSLLHELNDCQLQSTCALVSAMRAVAPTVAMLTGWLCCAVCVCQWASCSRLSFV